MLKVWWFPEYTPSQQITFDEVKKIIEKNYKQFWYLNINTPAVESNKILLAKSWEETSKQIFWLNGLAQVDDNKSYSLKYDLTVPFARYVLDYQDELTFPFKRFQIQPVWRWERQQKWRFKEFYQADIDVIWKNNENNSYIFYDTETIFTLYKTILEIINFVKINDKIIIQISNKKIVDTILKEWINDEVLESKIINLIDKYEKIWEESFWLALEDLFVSKETINNIIDILNTEFTKENILNLKKIIPNKNLEIWVDELYEVVNLLEKLSSNTWIELNYNINLKIVRWLDYYTWTVFETNFEKNNTVGSICSWWRYENLTWYIDPKQKDFSWVWWSIGLTRLLSILFEMKNIEAKSISTTQYLFVNFDETIDKIIELYCKYLNEWKNIELYPNSDKLKKQLKYANNKWIENVIILWQNEQDEWIYKIKNMETWEEKTQNL